MIFFHEPPLNTKLNEEQRCVNGEALKSTKLRIYEAV
ncbi:hypothetical protein XAC3810_250035 [Xanthomonas citri pv. citri]|uniref:Uncharacterized protein n=1 Tax=Xanthomonas citri pv. citri TaxID=611301 RepID=A0A0U4YK29_XANCI|nr:Hypothetical Protein XCAW_02838 [Xanthomonas citri subsp. citri Aw12879]CEE21518.1 hypothetical protein XAC9322_240035 [Xanthomonas citri pv. citri]CEE23122.1 hypothetical protein XAC1083_230035 [Xanthomonas citri pv. citri]CEE31468.1 hypothetical protein XAC3810_250035 [Xanthomonas citri pv. citri]CEE37888.1 hypothetical protein XAC908_370009 [Xanthomonas citri pv. citri]